MGTFSSETSANRHNSSKFETLIALQNDLRWLLLHSWFSKFPRGRPPGPPYKKSCTGKFWISFFYPNSAPRRHPLILIQRRCYFLGICLWQNMLLWSVVLFVASFLPPFWFSPILPLLLLGYGLLLCKGKFPAFFFFFFFGSGKFYWLSKFSTDKWLIA